MHFFLQNSQICQTIVLSNYQWKTHFSENNSKKKTLGMSRSRGWIKKFCEYENLANHGFWYGLFPIRIIFWYGFDTIRFFIRYEFDTIRFWYDTVLVRYGFDTIRFLVQYDIRYTIHTVQMIGGEPLFPKP